MKIGFSKKLLIFYLISSNHEDIIISEGCIGSMVDGTFKALTNWCPKVVSMVMDPNDDEVVQGVIVEHPPVGSDPSKHW